MARELKNLLVNRIAERELARLAPDASGRLLDIGCGTKPYKRLFSPYVTEHVGLDHVETLHDHIGIDLFGTAYDIPAGDSVFDTVLCTAVLEHLEEPQVALREARRILRDGGLAIYTVPFIWHLHEEPRDFYRYTPYVLEYLFKRAGFQIVSLRPLAGYWVTTGQLFVYYLYRFHRGPLRWVPVIPLLGLIIQGAAAALDRVDRAEAWSWMHVVVARASTPTT